MAFVRGMAQDFMRQGVPRYFTTGTARFTLVLPAHNGLTATFSASGQRAPVQHDVDVQFDGSFQVGLPSNDQLDPAGTCYAFVLLMPNVRMEPRRYVFDGDRSYDLAEAPLATDEQLRLRHVAGVEGRIARHLARLAERDALASQRAHHQQMVRYHQEQAGLLEARLDSLHETERQLQDLRLQLRELQPS